MQHELDCSSLRWSALDEGLIRWRCAARGELHRSSLSELLAAMAVDAVHDFPALRPHQRHPWHAFLAQLGAIVLHGAGQPKPWAEADRWRDALLALTPNDPDGAAWCLVAPPDRPALLQPPVPGERISEWKILHAADELDMLVTSKNHDLKAARARQAEADDWIFALVSLQTQEGFLGAGNYGVSRMNGGFASRAGVGVAQVGNWGGRWMSDVQALLAQRESIAEQHGLTVEHGYALLWLPRWSGEDSLPMEALDPLYIEVCRRVRLLSAADGALQARATGSKCARVAGKDRNGVTGDPWSPIDAAEAKALTVSGAGFEYKLMSELLTGGRFAHGAAWRLDGWPQGADLELIAQATVRGQGKTEGYHERRIPISPKLRKLLAGPQRLAVAAMAKQRIEAIAALRKLLWSALVVLFSNGKGGESSDGIADKAGRFARPFEQGEDARFFGDLALEAEAQDSEQAALHLQWLLGLAERAERVLTDAFDAGPRSAIQRYKARSAALSRFHGGLRGTKPVLPDLAAHYERQRLADSATFEGQIHA